MASSTNINVPLHVRHDWLNLVVARLAGAEFEKRAHSDSELYHDQSGRLQSRYVPRSYDPELPAGEGNSWYLTPLKPHYVGVECCSPSDMSFGIMKFTNMCGREYEWYFHQECEGESHKQLSPGSYAFSIAMAKKIIDVFGGTAVFNDEKNTGRPDHRVSVRKAILPPMRKDQTSNDRYYQFQNMLDNLSPISSLELLQALTQYRAGDHDLELLSALQSREKKLALEVIAAQHNPDLGQPGSNGPPKPKF